jgi:hypothetical protein
LKPHHPLIQAGFPPHAVAFWTGHTLTEQERHHIEDCAYPTHAERDCSRFGTLSNHGQAAHKAFARYAGVMG